MKFINKIYKNLPVIMFYIVPILQLVMVELADGSYLLHTVMIPFNLAIYTFLFWSIYFLTKSRIATIISTSVFFYLIALTNQIVYQFRGSPFMLNDIFAVRTAVGVAGGYKLKIVSGLIISTIFLLILVGIGIIVKVKKDLFKQTSCKKVYKRILAVVISLLLLIGSVGLDYSSALTDFLSRHYKSFINEYDLMRYYDCNGVVFSLIHFLGEQKMSEPDGYTKEEFKYLNSEVTNVKSRPNIIVIMNEAFSDLTVLDGFETTEDVMPFCNSGEVTKGKLNVSVKGGNTANTEFEFLTGISMSMIPLGAVPFQTYINKDMISLPSVLNNCNYETYAFHPFYSYSWNIGYVYPKLGFNHRSYINEFQEKIKDASVVRNIVSDKSTYDYIIKEFEERDKNKGFFEFCVTLQNHGGYETYFDNVPWNIKVKDHENEMDINNYINLVNISDSAFKDFVGYFKNINEDTIILMFGDHQPNDMTAEYLYSSNSEEKKYVVPYVYWSNCGSLNIPENTSANYLAWYILDFIGAKNNYFDLIKSFENEYPILTQRYLFDKKNSKLMFNVKEMVNREQLLQKYKRLTYYSLFS